MSIGVWSKPVGETGSPPAPFKGGAGPPLQKGGREFRGGALPQHQQLLLTAPVNSAFVSISLQQDLEDSFARVEELPTDAPGEVIMDCLESFLMNVCFWEKL